MLTLYDVIDRAMTGRFCSESEFEIEMFHPKVVELVSKYGIEYDPQTPVPSDDDLADRVFQAGLELYRDVGTYCPDTERVIQFSEGELHTALKHARRETVLGEGRDAKTLVPRKPDSDIPPWCFVGALGAAVSDEQIYASLMEAYASLIPLADSITAPSLSSINGRTVRTDSPLEVLAAIRATTLGRESLRKGGRPGLPIMNSIATAGSDTAKIAGSKFGLRNSDTWCISHSAEMKIGYQRLNEVATAHSSGGNVLSTFAPMLGGFCGGPEGTAITNVAYLFASLLCMQSSCMLSFPMHFKYGTTTTRDTIWAKSVSVQAITRNSHHPCFVDHYVTAGPMTEQFFYENAADIASSVASGGHITAVGVAKAAKIDRFTPGEPRFSTEAAHAATGLTRQEANRIVKALLEKYESGLGDPPPGKIYQECWDIDTKQPSDEYSVLYDHMKAALKNTGLDFSSV